MTNVDITGKRILVVEDEEKVAKNICRALEEMGCDYDVAGNGIEGQEFARNNQYDMYIVDVMMPEKDGLTMIGELREEGNVVPVLCLTAKDEVGDEVRGLEAGADDYMTKPFTFDVLMARVRAMIRRSSAAPGAEIVYGEFSLDPVKHIVCYEGKDLGLTDKEYSIVELFIRKAETVVTRQEIADHTWDGGQVKEFTNTIDVYIKYIRNKMAAVCGGPLKPDPIKTVRGQGYKLLSVKKQLAGAE